MNHILSLKQAITLDRVAEYLSNIANESVTESDLLELALDGQITLSLTMSGRHWATPYTESAPKEVASLRARYNGKEGTQEFRNHLLAQVEYVSFCIHSQDDELHESDKLGPDFLDSRVISGVWDLSMLGVERELIAEIVSSRPGNVITFTDDNRLENNKPLIFRHKKDTDLLIGLFSIEDDFLIDGELMRAEEIDDIHMLGSVVRKVQQFPSGSFLVIRTENLQKFVSQIIDSSAKDHSGPAANSNHDSELKRAQRTLAALAIGLAKKTPAYKNGDKPNASQLAKLATEHLRDATSDRTPFGFSETTARQTITEALKACPELDG